MVPSPQSCNMNPTPPIEYDKNRTYTLKEFEVLNDWLKTHELVIEGEAIHGFELDSTGKLIPVPQTPIFKKIVVGEIARQLGNWNIRTRQNGVVTGSSGGFNLGTSIRAPAVAFTPRDIYRNLTPLQLLTFQGQPFHPSVIVEVEDVSTSPKLAEITATIENEYFPAGIQLGLLVDPINRTIFTFKQDVCGVVRRLNYGWRDVSCGDILLLRVSNIDEATSQVCHSYFPYSFYKCKAFDSPFGLTTEAIRARVIRW